MKKYSVLMLADGDFETASLQFVFVSDGTSKEEIVREARRKMIIGALADGVDILQAERYDMKLILEGHAEVAHWGFE